MDMSSTKDSLTFSVKNISNANVKLLIYSEIKPKTIQVDDKSFNSWKYSELSNIIDVNLNFKNGGKKIIKILKKLQYQNYKLHSKKMECFLANYDLIKHFYCSKTI